MRLVVDASTLVAESLRARGHALLTHPSVDLVMASEVWDESRHELRKRVALLAERRFLPATAAEHLLDDVLALLEARVSVVTSGVYAERMEEARRRIPRDPSDAPTVALALILNCAIWTADHDFFGCGVPIWTTETLQMHLAALATR